MHVIKEKVSEEMSGLQFFLSTFLEFEPVWDKKCFVTGVDEVGARELLARREPHQQQRVKQL